MSTKRIAAYINLDAIEHNIKALYNHMPEPKPIMAVIKANGYGHGSVEIANRLEKMSCVFGYAVATAEEAITLRSNNITKPILILGYTFSDDYERLIASDVMLTVFDIKSAADINEVATKLNTKAKVHLKVDTGMSRIGVKPDNSGLDVALAVSDFSNIEINGVFTHFARADELNLDNANNQLDKFLYFVNLLKDNNINPQYIHCANSASILQIPRAQISFVRAGIVIYGLWPSDEMIGDYIDLQPAMTIKSHIAYIKDIDRNVAISYGGTFISDKPMRVATVPVGYADGYPRSLSNKGYVLINGHNANIIGRVCMDQMMIDVTNLDANVLDEVVLLGQSGDKCITAEELGNISGRFNYELVCDFTSRVPRIY